MYGFNLDKSCQITCFSGHTIYYSDQKLMRVHDDSLSFVFFASRIGEKSLIVKSVFLLLEFCVKTIRISFSVNVLLMPCVHSWRGWGGF